MLGFGCGGAVAVARRVGQVQRVALQPDGAVQGADHVGVGGVVLPALLVLVVAVGGQLRVRIGVGVAGEHVAGQLLEAHAAERGGGPGEAGVDDLPGQACALEDLGGPIAVEGGDPHLRHDLEHALLGGALQVGLHLTGGGVVTPDAAVVGQLGHRLQRQARADDVGAVAEQAGEAVGVAGIVGLGDQRHASAQLLGDQPVVDGADRQDHRHGGTFVADRTVRGDEHLRAVADRGCGLQPDLDEAFGHALGPVGHRPGGVQAVHVEADVGVQDQLLQALRVHHEALELQQVGGRRLFLQDRRTGSEQGPQRHDRRLADRVDGRVGDLREALLEVLVDRPGPPGEDRQLGVVTHGGDGLLARRRHRTEDRDLLLLGVAGDDLAGAEVLGGGVDRQAGAHGRHVGAQPLAVGLAAGEVGLDLVVLEDPTEGGVDDQHLAGAQAVAADRTVALDADRADLGGHDDEAVVADGVAQRTQPVAVQGRGEAQPVGEDQAGRAVPGLDER